MVLQRLSGVTQNASPVLTLVTPFGGGKTHTLATLYHLATAGKAASAYSGVSDLLVAAGSASLLILRQRLPQPDRWFLCLRGGLVAVPGVAGHQLGDVEGVRGWSRGCFLGG